MPKYLISYRKVESAGQKPEWASFTTQSEASLEAHAIKERVERRMSVLGEQLWGDSQALSEEGYQVVLVNSNPATIMTDPEMAARTYIEPLTTEFVAKIIERERPQALLPTLGGQTALNLAVALSDDGTLERFGVEL